MSASRVLLLLLFVHVAIAILAGVHVYIADRLIVEPGLGQPWRGLGIAAVVVLGGLFVANPFAERLLPRSLARVVAWPAHVWMGVAFLLVVLLAASDVVLWGTGRAALAASLDAAAPDSFARLRAALVVGTAGLASALALRTGLAPPRLERVTVPLARWPRSLDGFRIVQISDIHIGTLLGRRFARQIADRVNALDPDLVAVTGDLVDGSTRALAGEAAPFGALRGRHGVFFVTGNHDHYSGVESWANEVESLGMRALRNARVALGGEDGFDLVGVDDHRGDLLGAGGGEDLDAALDGRDPQRAAVLLAHDPSTFKRASRRGIDLQISGHTHGGQIWPFGWAVRLVVPWVKGLHRVGDATLYVSRGTGFWGPPMRLFAPGEITELVLHSRPGPPARDAKSGR